MTERIARHEARTLDYLIDRAAYAADVDRRAWEQDAQFSRRLDRLCSLAVWVLRLIFAAAFVLIGWGWPL